MLQVDNDPIVLGAGNPSTSQIAAATLDPTGFEPTVNADMVLTYSSTDRKVTLTNVCAAYCRGNFVPLPEGWVSPAHADVTGTYYLRYDCATKQFLYDTAPWPWQDLQIAYTQYDAVSKIGRTIREMHSTSPWAWHRNDHYNIGTTRVSGGDVTGLVLNSNTAANRRPLVSACTVRDEDIDSVITALPAGSYTQRFLAGAGATRSFVFGAGDIVKVAGSQPLYNRWNGSAWVDTPMAVGNYAKLFLVAVPMASDTDSQAIRYMWVQPQTSSSTLSVVQAVTPNSITHGDSALLVSEFVFIEEIIIRYIGGNWSIFSQSKLTGSRILQVGSPSGAYLSSVSTDSSLTGNGTIGSPLSTAPLTNVAAPVSETKASLTIQSALKLEAKPLGILGNYITVRAVSSAVAGMSISDLTGAGTEASPYLIEIKLGTTVTNNTMTLIAAAIVAKTDVAAVVNAIVIIGATQMTAFAVAPLAGGVNGSVGYLGETRFDTNGIEWKMCYTTAGCYYWAIADSDVYPALDTEYISHYCVRIGKPVFKMTRETVTGASGGIVSTAHGIIGFSRLYKEADILIVGSTGINVGNYFYSTTDAFAAWVTATNCVTSISSTATLYNRTVRFKFKYIKV